MQKKYNKNLPIFAVIFTVLIKLPFLLTHHIQEDAFITWRVAQNLIDYGVIGFNGNTKISASTTHLYVFVSWLFNVIFGKSHFIYPLLIFNSVLFSIGSYWLSKLLLKDAHLQALFIVFFGLLPPAIKISILGMEYGLLFFLEMGLMYYGFFQYKKWALILFPILILFTRIDTVIFLGILFIIDLFWNRKINWRLILGGSLGVLVVLSFNWFYFHEIVNHTIVAKKIAYTSSYNLLIKLYIFFEESGHFWGMIKLKQIFNPITVFVLLFEIICFIYLVKNQHKRNFFLIFLFVFGWVKQVIFLSQASYFDWYYWVPQLVLFISVLIFVLEQPRMRKLWVGLFFLLYMIPFITYQTLHSIATGNGEWNYRRTIGLFLNDYEKDKKQWIYLEPAGYVPYYSGLKTIDEVGLVDAGVTQEMLKDRRNASINIIKRRKPKYILSYYDLKFDENASYYSKYYRLIKRFRIKEHLYSSSKLLSAIYHLKPSGRDYDLYERIDSNN